MKPGDIVGFLGNNAVSFMINVGTYGIPFYGLSHVGILARYEGELVLFESTSLSPLPCMIKNQMVSGVQAHHIPNVIEAYEGKMWHYPIRQKLRQWESAKLTLYLYKQLGIKYDMIGAGRSGGKILAWIENKFRTEDMTNLFCSELCAAAHREIERFDTLNASVWNPNSFTREERRRGILSDPSRIK